MSKLILERASVLEVWTCVPGAEGITIHQRLKNEPGGPAGHKVWVWDSIPSGTVIAADFTDGIVVQSTASLTQTAVNAFKAAPTHTPTEVLTYA
ncbi:hypothetical protein MNR02_06750 [Shinella sp. H4-D48]|uniref:hypothetical protein n=1 Tax=Shinella sp. H4-D48 TaxID=2925841 RepID=UPI001F53B03D|nr:hypothetical protein [Shinella sp. H4-D48]UNK39401.1 hypothetical protein MNR02_06750 [Shinella sp. H4-D48]